VEAATGQAGRPLPPVEVLAITHRRPEGLHNVKVSSRAARSGRREAKLNGMEVTFLEALEGWDRYVEVDGATALERFGELLDREDVRVERLVRAGGCCWRPGMPAASGPRRW
jgi:hypothetical protein